MRTTKLYIESIEQYEALIDLGELLNKRFSIAHAYTLISEVKWNYNEMFGRCDHCSESLMDCTGHERDDPYGGREYNDGEDFF